MPLYTADPVRFDHDLIIGDTYRPGVGVFQAQDDSIPPAWVAVDITGAVGAMRLCDGAGGAVLATGTVTLVDAAAGEFTWEIGAATTADLQPNPKAKFDVVFTFADASVRTVLEGLVNVRRRMPG